MSGSPYWSSLSSTPSASLEVRRGSYSPGWCVCVLGGGVSFHLSPCWPSIPWLNLDFLNRLSGPLMCLSPLKGQNKTSSFLTRFPPFRNTLAFPFSDAHNLSLPQPSKRAVYSTYLLKGNSYRVAIMGKRKTSTCLRTRNQVVKSSQG